MIMSLTTVLLFSLSLTALIFMHVIINDDYVFARMGTLKFLIIMLTLAAFLSFIFDLSLGMAEMLTRLKRDNVL